MAADGGCERDAGHKINVWYKTWGALASVMSNRILGLNAKKCLYEGVIVPTALNEKCCETKRDYFHF